jgi:hypothetical protein
MIDKYFKRPVFWDYLLSLSLSIMICILVKRYGFQIPKDEIILSIVSDLSTVALTLSGFILTLLTVLISFKSTSKSKNDILLETDSLFDIFFSTNLYFETVKLLKNAIISLTLIAVTGYSLKLILDTKNYFMLFAFNILSLFVILLTLLRCLTILSKIIKIQKDN